MNILAVLIISVLFLENTSAQTGCIISMDSLGKKAISEAIEKPLISGIPVDIKVLLKEHGKTTYSKIINLQYDLWNEKYLILVEQHRSVVQGSDVFYDSLWCFLELKISEKFKDGELVILLNPPTKKMRSSLENWAIKQAGTYNNFGLNIRWARDDDEKLAEKVIYRKSYVSCDQ